MYALILPLVPGASVKFNGLIATLTPLLTNVKSFMIPESASKISEKLVGSDLVKAISDEPEQPKGGTNAVPISPK